MMCEFLVVLAKMENNGIFIDNQALLQVEKDFQEEHDQLRVELDEIIYEKMGDTSINPSSPEQLSWLIYGARVTDKKSHSFDRMSWESKSKMMYCSASFSLS